MVENEDNSGDWKLETSRIDSLWFTQYSSVTPLWRSLMTRLRIAYVAGNSSTDRFDVATGVRGLAAAGRNDCITSFLALLVSFSLLTTPLWAAPSSWLGIVVYADR